MLNVVIGIAFVALAATVLVWRTFQDGRVIADRPDGAPMPQESRAGGTVVGDFSGISGGVDGGSAGFGGDGGACGADGGGTAC